MAQPIVWTQSNILFAAHPTRPQIHGQIIPTSLNSRSSQRFDLPSPGAVSSSPALFAPPTCLCSTPKDTHFFAFYPPSSLSLEGGVSCVWERSNEITSWNVKEFWLSERGNNVITGRWLDNDRRWSISPSGAGSSQTLCHLPTCGPRTLHTPTLILVMQLHEVQIHHQSPFVSTKPPYYNHIRASLNSPSEVHEIDVQNGPRPHHDRLGARICLHASIGVLYNESSLIIATHSTTLPWPSTDLLNAFALPFVDGDDMSGFDDLGLQRSVDLCEVLFDVHSLRRNLVTIPIASIRPCLAQKPIAHELPPRYLTEVVSVSLIPNHLSEQTQLRTKTGPGCTLLVLSSSEQHVPDQSCLETWNIVRTEPVLSPSNASNGKEISGPSEWNISVGPRRVFEVKVPLVADFEPSPDSLLLITCEHGSNHAPMTPPSVRNHDSARETAQLRRIRRNDLKDDPNFLPSSIKSSHLLPEESVPTAYAFSPNYALCSLRSGLYSPQALSVVSTPRPTQTDLASSPGVRVNYLSEQLSLSIVNSSDPSDIVRAFWSENLAIKDISVLMKNTLVLLMPLWKETSSSTSTSPAKAAAPGEETFSHNQWAPSLFGFLVALYRASPSAEIRGRWRTGLALCEIYACERAFDEILSLTVSARPREAAVMWQICVMSAWIVGLCEDIFRDALRYHASRRWEARRSENDISQEGNAYPFLAIILMPHILAIIRKLIVYVKQAHEKLLLNDSRQDRNAMLHSASKQLISALDSSPLNIEEIPNLFRQLEELITEESTALAVAHESVSDALDALNADLSPSTLLAETLLKCTLLFTTHAALRGPDAKTRILIPSASLLDIPLVVRRLTDVAGADQDVISKTPLSRHGMSSAIGIRSCVRCGSKANLRWLDASTRVIGASMNGAYWAAFVDDWERNCVCGGNWVLSMTSDS